MADAQETPAGQEPSMEEILASIRKIITDENVSPAANGAAQDVIELTQMVQDDGSVVEIKPPAPAPKPEPVAAAAPPPSAPPPPPPAPPPPPKVEAAMSKTVETPSAASLTSEPVVSAAATSLSSLASTVEIERLAHAPLIATPMGNGARTLEDMVIELMRPLLKNWLDQNLPATVERLVQKEIERISRKAQD